MKEIIFTAPTPALAGLCCLHVNLPENHDQKPFQPQIIKCREILFTEPGILATPLLGHKHRINLIVPISLYKTGRLQTRLQNMGLNLEKPRRVTAGELQACLTYTLTAKLAPLWNKVGDIFIQGRDFVSSSDKKKAVRLEMTVTEQQIYFCLTASFVRNPPINLESLGVCPIAAERFFVDPSPLAQVAECHIENQWCFVLPSMKKGQVVCARKQLPRDGPFTSYKDVKKYWKNMYGYRLPESDEGLLYYQVYFKMLGSRLFTYPEVCLRSHAMQTFHCPESHSTLQQFVGDVQSKLPSLCGHRLQVAPRALQSDTTLSSAAITPAKDNSCLNFCEVQASSRDKSQYAPQQPRINGFTAWKPSAFRHQSYTQTPTSTPGSMTAQMSQPLPGKTATSGTLPRQSAMGEQNVSQVESAGKRVTTADTPVERSEYSSAETNNIFINGERHDSEDKKSRPNINGQNNTASSNTGRLNSSGSLDSVQETSSLKLRPVFKSKPKVFSHDLSQKKTPSLASKIVPMFKMAGRSTKPVASNGGMFADLDKFKSTLNFTGSKPESAPTSVDSSQQGKSSNKPNFVSRKPVFGSIPTLHYSQKGPITPAVPKTPLQMRLPSGAITSATVFNRSASQTPCSANKIGTGQMSVPQTPIRTPKAAQKRALEATPGATPGGTSGAKKPRAKPRVQQELDITQLAAAGQLAKCNTATLSAWLKERGLPYKTKDKKEDLLASVSAHILGPNEP